MAEPFFPQDFETATTSPTVSMATALFVIKATIFEPVKNADVQLPSHVWELVHQPPGSATGRAIARSTPSDAAGVCALMDPQSLVDGNYSLLFLPLPADIRGGYVKDLEAWIDLDTGDWGPAPKPSAGLERRRLLRVPAWSSLRKASRGGFKESPNPSFSRIGSLTAAEVVPFGAPGKPWDMALDFQWVRTKLKLFFFNWKQNQEELLPPGLLAEAVSEARPGRPQARLGAGTAISPSDGTFYLLLEGDAPAFRDCQIQFVTPGAAFVDLTQPAKSPDLRLVAGQPVPGTVDDRNRLPGAWHSHGMRARFATGPNAGKSVTGAKGKIWDQLRTDIAKSAGARDTTIAFHLDDVVLCDQSNAPIAIKGSPQSPTLFDHFLAIIKPGPNKPYQTVAKMVAGIVPADVAYQVGPAPPGGKKVLEVSTRLIHFEGTFHDLRDDRLGGTPGATLCVGARSARASQHPSLLFKKGNPLMKNNGALELHFVDVPGVLDPVSKTQLQHLLIYISVELDVDSQFPPALVASVQKLLAEAGERWSPGHPGVPGMAAKRYALLPSDPAKRGQRITRIRTFFAEMSDGATLDLKLRKETPGNDRSGQTEAFLFLIDEAIEYLDTAVQRDVGPFSSRTDIGDGQSVKFHTLAHEFGHALGLPDEYCESINPTDEVDPSVPFLDPRLPKFAQRDEGFSDWRPFYTDADSLMVSNHLPRLRHLWHHVKQVNDSSSFSLLADRPYVLSHESFRGGTLSFSVPPDDKKPPYQFIFRDEKIPGGHGECALYPLGDDEGSVEGMFRAFANGPGPAARLQAVLLVRARLRFIVDATLPPTDRWDVLKKFHEKIYDNAYSTKIRFVLVGPAPFSRIAVMLQPLYAFGSTLNPFDGSDLVFDIEQKPSRPRPDPFASPSTSTKLLLELSDFAFEPAFRLVLGAPTFVTAGGKRVTDLSPLKPSDVQSLARLVESKLGEPPSSRSVGVF